MVALARPGYVYVMANASLPGWRKVGHTHRPPHRRAHELSRTALPTAFDVEYARFFWDALLAEQEVHRRLMGVTGYRGRSKEFFNLPLEKARQVILALPEMGRPASAEAPLLAEEAWEETLEGRETLWEWAEADWVSTDLETRKKGWRAMERMSAEGWAEGSWRLAEHLLHADPSVAGANRSAWVLDAASTQGLAEAALRAAWLRSWEGQAESMEEWRRQVERLPCLFGDDPTYWPFRVRDTLRAEITLWATQPHRRLEIEWLQALEGQLMASNSRA